MKQAYKLEAPEGGWGILICIGMALPFISCFGGLLTFGLSFGEFLKNLGATTQEVAFVNSSFYGCLSVSGLFAGALFNSFGLRRIALLGATLYLIGSIWQIFVRSTLDLTFALSICQGFGMGVIIPAAYTTFNNYFVKKRVFWMSFAQTLIGLGNMLYPVSVQFLLETYGFRGCMAMIAAFNAHAVLGMQVMHPVKWHMRKVPITEHVMEPIRQVQENGEGTTAAAAPLMAKQVTELQSLKSRSSSMASLGNWSGPVVNNSVSPAMSISHTRRHSMQEQPNKKQAKITKWAYIVNFLDLKLLKKPVYCNIIMGLSFALYSDLAFFTLQPLYLFELGFPQPDVAKIIAIGAAADLASRMFLAFSSIFIQVRARSIYLAGAFFMIIARFAFLEINDFMGMACITAAMGFLRTWIHVPLPLVFAEYLPQERFATGYSLFMFLQGQFTFAIGPVVGYLRDQTKSYVLTFHALNLFMALCVVPWVIEIFILRLRQKKIGEDVSEDSSAQYVY